MRTLFMILVASSLVVAFGACGEDSAEEDGAMDSGLDGSADADADTDTDADADADTDTDADADSDTDSDENEYAWHEFLGSSADDYPMGLARDGDGNLYVTGHSNATWNGPGGEAPLHSHSGGFDVLVLKLGPDGAYQWHTFYGSWSTGDRAWGIAVDGSGGVFVTGTAEQPWFGPNGEPSLNWFAGTSEAFVLKLGTDGAYQWHTFYGASNGTYAKTDGRKVLADGKGGAYVIGTVLNYPWDGPDGEAPLHAFAGIEDAVVLKLDADGAYQWHTFYGGQNMDQASSFATDAEGNVYVTGFSDIPWNGPTDEPPLHAHSGSNDILVLKLDADGGYVWHAFYGGADVDNGTSIALDAAGGIYVGAYAKVSWDGPDGEAPLHAHSSGADNAILKLGADGAYQWHTFYGAAGGNAQGREIAAGESGVYLAGDDLAWNGPADEAPRHGYSGGLTDALIIALSQDGAYRWHAFYGGEGDDAMRAITIGPGSRLLALGFSPTSWDGPDAASPLLPFSGGQDLFVLSH